MVKQIINVGVTPNDRRGDPVRIAFQKSNDNFTELYTNVATISNEVSTLSDVAFSGSYTDLLNIPPGGPGGTSDRLVNGNKQVILGANGTLTVPSPTSNQFATVFSAANYVPTLSKPTLTLTGTPWALNGQYVYAQNGETQLALDSIWPTLNNPGYTSGDTFTFDSTVHGIADFVLTIQLNDVVQAGPAGWTANVAASQPPVYASTIKSLGAVKVTASNSSWIFGTDGNLHYPDGSFSNTAFVGQATSAETLVNQGNATVTTGPTLGTQYIWDFGADGILTLPVGGNISANNGISILSQNGNQLQLIYNRAEILNPIPEYNANVTALFLDGSGATLEINTDTSGYVWSFTTDGKLTLPNESMIESATSTLIASGTATAALKIIYTDAMAQLTDFFTQNSAEPGYPWGVILPFPNANFAYSQIVEIAPGTFPNQTAVTTAAGSARGPYLEWLTANSVTNTTINVSDNSWTFGPDGVIILPGGTSFGRDVSGPNTVGVYSMINNDFVINTSNGLSQKKWAFDIDGKLTLPVGGDIVDSAGTSVLGGGASTDVYKFQFGTIGTKDNPDTGGWGGYNIVLDPGGESFAGLFIPSVASQDAGNSLNIYNNSVIGNNITLAVNSGSFVFKGTGTLELPVPNNLDFNNPSIKFGGATSVATNNYGFSVPGPVAGVVYNATTLNLASMKLLITIEGIEDGGDGFNHTQVCEMLVVRRVGATSSSVDSVVYGVIHTSLAPLATLTTQQSVDGRVEILAQPTNTTPIYVKVHATEVRRGD